MHVLPHYVEFTLLQLKEVFEKMKVKVSYSKTAKKVTSTVSAIKAMKVSHRSVGKTSEKTTGFISVTEEDAEEFSSHFSHESHEDYSDDEEIHDDAEEEEYFQHTTVGPSISPSTSNSALSAPLPQAVPAIPSAVPPVP